MKRFNRMFAVPILATAAGIFLNLNGFLQGGQRQWWELLVSLGYIAAWIYYMLLGPRGFQRTVATFWWRATAFFAATILVMQLRGMDTSAWILPAIVLYTPLSGLAVLTGTGNAFWITITLIGLLIGPMPPFPKIEGSEQPE